MPRIGAILILILTLASACFSEAQDVTTSTATTTDPTASSADTTADTTAGNPVDACRACQGMQCQGYAEACTDAAGCDICVDEPFDLVCLDSATFRPLAFCSCENCEDECSYMCPGGGDACRDCQMVSGCDQVPCVNDPSMECLPCVADPYAEGCQEDPLFVPLQTCECTACEPDCLWQCDGATQACASCLTESCMMPFGNCLGDDECEACFNNPSTPGCLTPEGNPANVLYGALGMCVCLDCSAPCGGLFGC